MREVTVDDRGFANGVVYYDENGDEQFQRAEIVIMACNGVGTPRILLNSKSRGSPMVSRTAAASSGRTSCSTRFGYVRRALRRAARQPQGAPGLLHPQQAVLRDGSVARLRAWIQHADQSADRAAEHRDGAASRTAPSRGARDITKPSAKRFDHVAAIGIVGEDLPEEHNTVTLDPELVDSDGIPAPKITYTYGENSLKMMEHGLARGEEAMRAAGAYDVASVGPLRPTGWHLLGTARMGEDPRTSVVNRWGRSHDVKNLFIVDGSIFVTSGGVNPASTIQACALYIADTMKKNLTTLFD